MKRAYYGAEVSSFRGTEDSHVLGELARHHGHALEQQQRNAWLAQIAHLKEALAPWPDGHLLLEFCIPRMGRRADAVLLAGGIVFVLEYKVGAKSYDQHARDQVLDYALDLKNFHEASHGLPIVPVVVATDAAEQSVTVVWAPDQVARPVLANRASLRQVVGAFEPESFPAIDTDAWLTSRYKPTPTIVEAARALYRGHRVEEISRSDAGAFNLSRTASAISAAIERAKQRHEKTICFVTGVPGSGKTLAGLNLVTERMRSHQEEHAVFLSGNGPLVAVLREALVRDEVRRARAAGDKLTKGAAKKRVHAFIQNIHHFRDDSLATPNAPVEQVVVFDEAQRAWQRQQASRFMREKRQMPDFDMSEPDFLLSVMDRHEDWCVVVCLIGGGQEINTGEAGLSEWFLSLQRNYPHWRVLYSKAIAGSEYSWGIDLMDGLEAIDAEPEPALHLAVNIRSFRAENVSAFVGAVIDGDADRARDELGRVTRYPIALTRDLNQAREWLRARARGTERYGLVASSNALRLKPVGLHVKSKIDPANWFLNDNGDVRASYALEDVATEFDIQGLELDWVGVCWDANFRRVDDAWSLHNFKGTRWTSVKDFHRRIYLANTYRVLLTRARQGMVIYIPAGSTADQTRSADFYDGTFEFLRSCGVPCVAG